MLIWYLPVKTVSRKVPCLISVRKMFVWWKRVSSKTRNESWVGVVLNLSWRACRIHRRYLTSWHSCQTVCWVFRNSTVVKSGTTQASAACLRHYFCFWVKFWLLPEQKRCIVFKLSTVCTFRSRPRWGFDPQFKELWDVVTHHTPLVVLYTGIFSRFLLSFWAPRILRAVALFSFCRLPLCCGLLPVHRLFRLMSSHLFIFCFVSCAFEVLSKKVLAHPNVLNISLWVKLFVVLGRTLTAEKTTELYSLLHYMLRILGMRSSNWYFGNWTGRRAYWKFIKNLSAY